MQAHNVLFVSIAPC